MGRRVGGGIEDMKLTMRWSLLGFLGFLHYFCLLMYMFEIVHNQRVFSSVLLRPQQWNNT